MSYTYDKQTWDTESFFTPTRMNHIEDGIKGVETELNTNTKPKRVWQGNAYTVGAEIQLSSYSSDKEYLFGFKPFTSGDGITFLPIIPNNRQFIQFTFWGNSSQHCAYRFTNNGNGKFTISNDSVGNASNNALLEVYERN